MLLFDPPRPEQLMKPRWAVRAIVVCIALIMGGVSALGTLEFAYLFVPLAAQMAGLTVNCSAAGHSMILNMAPLRYGGERRGKWFRGMLYYSVVAIAASGSVTSGGMRTAFPATSAVADIPIANTRARIDIAWALMPGAGGTIPSALARIHRRTRMDGVRTVEGGG